MHHAMPLRQKIIVMIAVMSGLFLVALDQTIIATALGKIVEEFNSFSSLSWVVTAYMLTSTVTVPIAGKLSDIFGRRLMLLVGVTVFTLASLLSGSSQDITQLIFYRAVQGIGGGILMANAFTIIGDLFSPLERGKWQGFIGAVFGLSSVVGPLLGGFLTDGHSLLGLLTNWRWTFWINIPVGIAAFALIARYCPPLRHEHRKKIDYLGATFITLALSSLILAVDNTDKVFSSLIDSGISLGAIKAVLWAIVVAATGLFVWTETRAEDPIIPLSLFKKRTFSVVMTIAVLFGAAFLGAILYLTQFNQQVFGATATTAGLMLLPMVGGLMLSSITTGQIVTKTGKYKRFIIAGFTIATISILSLVTLTPHSPFWHEAVLMAFAGLGMGMGMPIMNLAVQNEVEQRQLGVATSSSQLFRGLGSTVGTAVLGSALTLGVAASLGDYQQDPYIQALKQQPAAAQMIGKGDVSIDTVLTLNTPDVSQKIRDGLDKGLASRPMPAPVKQAIIDDLAAKQENFKTKVVNSFTASLHKIFYISATLMAVATLLAFAIKEKPLRGGIEDTPGIA